MRPVRDLSAFVCGLAVMLLGAGVAQLAATASTAAATRSLLIGDRTVERHRGATPAGKTAAFPLTTSAGGTLGALFLYVDARTRANTVRVGVYTGTRAGPRRLVTEAALRRPPRSGWAAVRLRSVKLHARRTYWVAILGVDGRLVYRDRVGRDCRGQTSRQPHLRHLPDRWAHGGSVAACRVSVFLALTMPRVSGGPPGSTSNPTKTGTTGTTTTGTTTSSPGQPPSQKGCIANLAACGYPDAGGNDGAHGALTPVSGPITLNSPGEVFENKDVHGGIRVTANNVTIRNVRVTVHGGEGIIVYSGRTNVPIDGTTITDTTIRGATQTSSDALSDGVLNAGGNTHTTAQRLYVYNSGSTDWNGPGAIFNSYMIVDTFVSGAHDEAIYEGGGDDGVQATHDTLLNNQPQTAVVLNGSDYGPAAHDSVQNCVLAGGGYVIYGGYGAGYPLPVDGPHVLNNRFVRAPYGGFSRKGGSGGVAASIDKATIDWSGNYWDDNLTPVSW